MRFVAALTCCALLSPAEPQQPGYTISVSTNLVVVNVDVRDGNGRPVEGLKASDFTIWEDNKPQQIVVFDYQRLDTRPEVSDRPAASAAPEHASAAITPSRAGEIRYQDRRLIVLLFDLSAMPPEDQVRAQTAALRFLDRQVTPADMIALMTFSSKLRVLQDFTEDRQRVRELIRGFHIGEASDLAELGATGDDSQGEDNGAAFTPDDTEFNVFNTDRKLSALESAANMLASLPEKKALVYFSSGLAKTGLENQSQLRATTNAAVRANVAFYPIDARGSSPARLAATRPKVRNAAPRCTPEARRRPCAPRSTINRRRSSPWPPTPGARRCSTTTTWRSGSRRRRKIFRAITFSVITARMR